MIRVLVVDDQELMRSGLRGVLRVRYGFDVVGECSDGSTVVDAVRSGRPDVVLMDIRMPGVDGVTATELLRREPNSPPVLVLTTFDDDEVLAGALRAGASGFLLKGGPAEDLQRAVRTVAGGGAWLDPAVTGRVLTSYRSAAPTPAGDPRLARLTAREREVLELIGRGRSNAEIAAVLVLGEGTVKTHVNHVLRQTAPARSSRRRGGRLRQRLGESPRSGSLNPADRQRSGPDRGMLETIRTPQKRPWPADQGRDARRSTRTSSRRSISFGSGPRSSGDRAPDS